MNNTSTALLNTVNAGNMARKVVHIGIILMLLLTTTGISISRHYCGDNLRSTAIMHIPDACCNSGSCCHTEI
ncbi:MAG: hypothetical protein U9N72_02660 [Bacteroidota bacterium]|nr:hypothetical protein [Bacteroidota bacterium]